MSNLNGELQKAVEEEEKIKKLILKLLHLNGITASDASRSILNENIVPLIKGKG